MHSVPSNVRCYESSQVIQLLSKSPSHDKQVGWQYLHCFFIHQNIYSHPHKYIFFLQIFNQLCKGIYYFESYETEVSQDLHNLSYSSAPTFP